MARERLAAARGGVVGAYTQTAALVLTYARLAKWLAAIPIRIAIDLEQHRASRDKHVVTCQHHTAVVVAKTQTRQSNRLITNVDYLDVFTVRIRDSTWIPMHLADP